jgi:hypothetical protein
MAHLRIVYSILICAAVCLHPSIPLADTFFGDALSQRERIVLDRSMGQMADTTESLDALMTLMMYDSFAKGDCEQFFELETKAKSGDGASQYILGDLYRKGYCVSANDKEAFRTQSNFVPRGAPACWYAYCRTWDSTNANLETSIAEMERFCSYTLWPALVWVSRSTMTVGCDVLRQEHALPDGPTG